MQKVNHYRSICFTGGILLLILVIVNLINPFESGIYDLTRDILILVTVMFAFFWQRKVLILISLIAFTIDFNIELISYSMFPIYDPDFINSELKVIGNIFIFIGFICFIIGFWKISENRYLNLKTKFKVLHTFFGLIMISGLIQFLIWIVID